MTEKIKPVDGQCGTCAHAQGFGYADSPSGPEDGVHCGSEEHAKQMDWETGSDYNLREFKEYGFVDIWRLECIAEEGYECPQWRPKEEVKVQMMPAPDEAPLTMCPWCGVEYNIKETREDDYYTHVGAEWQRHKACGRLVRMVDCYEADTDE